MRLKCLLARTVRYSLMVLCHILAESPPLVPTTLPNASNKKRHFIAIFLNNHLVCERVRLLLPPIHQSSPDHSTQHTLLQH